MSTRRSTPTWLRGSPSSGSSTPIGVPSQCTSPTASPNCSTSATSYPPSRISPGSGCPLLDCSSEESSPIPFGLDNLPSTLRAALASGTSPILLSRMRPGVRHRNRKARSRRIQLVRATKTRAQGRRPVDHSRRGGEASSRGDGPHLQSWSRFTDHDALESGGGQELALDDRADLQRFGLSLLACQVHFTHHDIVGRVLRPQELKPSVNGRCVLALAKIVDLVLERVQRPVATVPEHDLEVGVSGRRRGPTGRICLRSGRARRRTRNGQQRDQTRHRWTSHVRPPPAHWFPLYRRAEFHQ